MSSCWDADPFKRPPFMKVVESIEQQLSDATKHVGSPISALFSKTAQRSESHSSTISGRRQRAESCKKCWFYLVKWRPALAGQQS